MGHRGTPCINYVKFDMLENIIQSTNSNNCDIGLSVLYLLVGSKKEKKPSNNCRGKFWNKIENIY